MRSSGILLHISSLDSDYGIGTFGKNAFDFVDFLKDSGQDYWQVLPLGPTGYGDSPYQSFSTFAGNPYFIDLDLLAEEGLLDKEELKQYDWGSRQDQVDYGKIYGARLEVWHKAFDRFIEKEDADFEKFCEDEKAWLDDYAMYMAISKLTNTSWHNWEDGLAKRKVRAMNAFRKEHENDILFWKFLQYKFFSQWAKVKSYANELGIRIIGDLPIYVSDDGSDVWAHPELFDMDKDLSLRNVAGVPPDAFSADGQLWGNPVYKWRAHKKSGYQWWKDRMAAALRMYDVVRIDHFRGFEGYYSIPAGDKTAVNGQWVKGPGLELFKEMGLINTGEFNVIAEDLGVITPEVERMLAGCGYPGMKILQFAFDGFHNPSNTYLPHNIVENSVVYPGTHDNNTTLGWWKELGKGSQEYCIEYGAWESDDDICDKIITMAFASRAKLAMVAMQDWLDLDADARMNTPSTTSANWAWRLKKGELDERVSERILRKTKVYDRYTKTIVDEIIEVENPEDIEDEIVIEVVDANTEM